MLARGMGNVPPPRRDVTWRLGIAYQGGAFSGWQRQDGPRTVQQVIEDAFSLVADQKVHVRAAGRTDAGVHARAQAASTRFTSRLTVDKLLRAMPSILPDDVAVTDVQETFEAFNAKRHSIGKRYVYRILNRVAPDPFSSAFSWRVPRPLDVDRMQSAAQRLVGAHDYDSFRASECVATHAERYIWKVDVTRLGPQIEVEVRGNAFCMHMVRIIAGTLVDAGAGKLTADDVSEMLEARDRRRAGQTAPAQGLTMEEVYYPDTVERAEIPEDAVFPGWPALAEDWPSTTS